MKIRYPALLLSLMLTSAAHADVFRLLDDPRDAAQARADVIRQAKYEIDALYFLARNDRITMAALALMRDAKRRGVPCVRLIVDANFQHIPKAVLAHLSDEGVLVRVYHPLTARHPTWLFRRMHEKVVVVDSAYYITGGRNLAESYFGLAQRNYVDRDVYVTGSSAIDADRHFDQLWESSDVSALHVNVSAKERTRASAILDDAVCRLEQAGMIDSANHDWSSAEVDSVEFLHDPLPDQDEPRLVVRLADAIANAKSEVVIESPYLVPTGGVLDLLKKKVADGVRVRIVTNSRRSSDGLLPYVGYLKYRRRLRRAGIELHEFKGPDMLHAKSMVIDGRRAFVGSYNVDPRSENLNAEAMAVTEDDGCAQELLASIDAHAANSWLVGTREQRTRPSAASRVRAWLLRLLLPVYESQL